MNAKTKKTDTVKLKHNQFNLETRIDDLSLQLSIAPSKIPLIETTNIIFDNINQFTDKQSNNYLNQMIDEFYTEVASKTFAGQGMYPDIKNREYLRGSDKSELQLIETVLECKPVAFIENSATSKPFFRFFRDKNIKIIQGFKQYIETQLQDLRKEYFRINEEIERKIEERIDRELNLEANNGIITFIETEEDNEKTQEMINLNIFYNKQETIIKKIKILKKYEPIVNYLTAIDDKIDPNTSNLKEKLNYIKTLSAFINTFGIREFMEGENSNLFYLTEKKVSYKAEMNVKSKNGHIPTTTETITIDENEYSSNDTSLFFEEIAEIKLKQDKKKLEENIAPYLSNESQLKQYTLIMGITQKFNNTYIIKINNFLINQGKNRDKEQIDVILTEESLNDIEQEKERITYLIASANISNQYAKHLIMRTYLKEKLDAIKPPKEILTS